MWSDRPAHYYQHGAWHFRDYPVGAQEPCPPPCSTNKVPMYPLRRYADRAAIEVPRKGPYLTQGDVISTFSRARGPSVFRLFPVSIHLVVSCSSTLFMMANPTPQTSVAMRPLYTSCAEHYRSDSAESESPWLSLTAERYGVPPYASKDVP